jgi:hypothetical protein
MSKIDPKAMKMAMREAARMREANEDPYYLATSLLGQNFRIRQLENIANLAEQLADCCDSQEIQNQLREALSCVRSDKKKAA